MDRNTALALLSSQCAATTYPMLDSTALGLLIDAEAGASTWQASHAYSYGDLVAPSVRNGHVYRCIVAGTSSTAEPIWPLYTAPDEHVALTQPFWHGGLGPYPGSQVADGSTLVWIEGGYDAGADFSRGQVKRATYHAWLQKAALASADYDVKKGKDSFARSQVIDHCTDMAQKYVPMSIA